MAKALGMIRLARTHGWDAACLSDVHCPWEFTDYYSLPGAPRDLRNTVVAIEEFIVIFGTRSAILLSPAAQQAWRDHECHVARHECGRLLTVSLRIKGASYAITSVYAPDQSYGADLRRDFFELCDEVRLGIPATTSQLWLGDWNSHIGADSCQHYSGLGRYGMNTPTGAPGRELAAWLAHGPQLDLIDSYFKISPRGTWSHPVGGRHIHFELDVCAASSPLRRRFSRVKTFQVEFSDHCGKTYHLALAKAHEAWRELRQRGAEAQKRPLALHRMQGSLPEAVALREQYVRLCEDQTPPLDENCPLSAIRDIAAAAAEEVVGRESKRWCTPYLAGHAREMEAECDALRELRRRQRLAPTTEESTALRQQHRARSQAYRALRRKWRAEWISGMVTELERSMQFHDMPDSAEMAIGAAAGLEALRAAAPAPAQQAMPGSQGPGGHGGAGGSVQEFQEMCNLMGRMLIRHDRSIQTLQDKDSLTFLVYSLEAKAAAVKVRKDWKTAKPAEGPHPCGHSLRAMAWAALITEVGEASAEMMQKWPKPPQDQAKYDLARTQHAAIETLQKASLKEVEAWCFRLQPAHEEPLEQADRAWVWSLMLSRTAPPEFVNPLCTAAAFGEKAKGVRLVLARSDDGPQCQQLQEYVGKGKGTGKGRRSWGIIGYFVGFLRDVLRIGRFSIFAHSCPIPRLPVPVFHGVEHGMRDPVLVAVLGRKQFYNPKLYKPPAKVELSAQGAIERDMSGAAALVQVSARRGAAVAPPPETWDACAAKSEESSGVIAMIDLLIKDLDTEMTEAETEEKDSQADYDKTIADAKGKRTTDSKDLTSKAATKADLESDLPALKGDSASAAKELMATDKYISQLHGECDWLLQYYGAREEARSGEIDALGKAKAVLSGADYSLLQK
ncbi:unnamed protein product [Prorocentrum cordatum]|uniref:Endonuclease/exonuclease/phosphatase domain-containing protein n=1 Tax=Prorocentrum cordatum TaxID=2364126 RepID=A0ABN9QJ54_9DINO|nr:unnamed protein product [Polarella glacialis]